MSKSINLSDLSNGPYLASDDFKVGTVLPAVTIERIVIEEVPTPGSTKKSPKVVAWFKGASKGWVMNKTVGRQIARILGETKNLDTTWIGARVSLKIVGDVRRPDGTKGNAFRLENAWPAETAPADPAKASA